MSKFDTDIGVNNTLELSNLSEKLVITSEPESFVKPDEISEKLKPTQISFMAMKLEPKITKLNIVAFFLLNYINSINTSLQLSFYSIILSDPYYYNVSKDVLGGITSKISLYAEIINMITGACIGPVFDFVGRKKILILC